ncbi:MAG: protein-L-isoaspartate(D-aspartate) O-methyltransferase [Desulfobacteraceae bacterium]|nr:protein-L-isoaspartate(D-aspartate) O-methyltransferase [Desulfobacteraceae bacterium]
MRFEHARHELVERVLRFKGIRDERVLAAMRKVPRHEFVPEPLLSEAYADYPLPIGHGQTISQPYIVALMTAALELSGGEKVLEVGTGSGYQTAILAELAGRVISIERIAALAEGAREVLRGYKDVTLVTGDGSKGYAEEAPYDAIIVTAAAHRTPPALPAQLAEAGRLVIPVGPPFYQRLLKITKTGGEFREEELEVVSFVPLVEGAG